MEETLTRVRSLRADADLTDMTTDLITAIRKVLIHPEMPNHLRLAEIAHLVDELAPPPGPEAEPDAEWIALAAAGDPYALAMLLSRHRGPVTILLEELAGGTGAGFDLHVPDLERADRNLTNAEAVELDASL